VYNCNPIEEAKSFFKEHLAKGRILQFEEIKFEVDDEDFIPYHSFLKRWYEKVLQFNFLPENLSQLEEVFIHGPLELILKSANSEELYELDITKEDLDLVFEVLVLKNNLTWNYTEPFVSFYTVLSGVEVRVTLIHHSASTDQVSKMFIRILNSEVIPISSYSHNTHFFKDLISQKKNILVSGATGSGKTTFINSLLGEVPGHEHTIIIEDTKELISPNKYTTKLLTDKKNPNKSMNQYLSYALRMSPERIILGEVRSKEVESCLLAMNTGHNGFLTTIHANSASDALQRLALLFKIYSNKELSFELILKLITSNIDYVVHLENKKISEVIEVFGSNQENVFFEEVDLSN
jgi:type IV secretory pathway ATPase VirB11/archaellum biosynthesis ATPase